MQMPSLLLGNTDVDNIQSLLVRRKGDNIALLNPVLQPRNLVLADDIKNFAGKIFFHNQHLALLCFIFQAGI